ncbi:unnamed protein product [Eruca vesicaria subsp. sativa]|uniref:Uncharacterized protein n=1 Tax=Eruca vesicaria subsp. sativa TaxID=29727 RepID=A0ABC8IUJ6_ERUVS|nr:unnamed protein product [Eruca vesicaria subsp. sativa]
MFLSSSSTDEGSPNNPSTSFIFLSLTNCSDELGQSHHSNFSIRDYACNNRSKNIQKSWPFSSTSLQLCLKHGLSDPLPSMQPLNSVVSHPPEASSLKKPDIALVEAISCKRKFEKLVLNHALAESKHGFENGSLVSNSKSKIKVANIDSGQQAISKPSNPRGKPRMKVKTMVDIYAAAKGCTLEDIDERNGRKWAVTSSYSNQVVSEKNKTEVCNKRKNHSVIDEDAAGNGIGPVYTDAKGQKLRIISEFNEKASEPSREHEEDVSEKKYFKGKRLGGKKYYKHCKDNASEILEYLGGGYSGKCRVMEKSETPGTTQCRIKKNEHPMSADPLVSTGPSHASVDLSETVSYPLISQNSWRSCGESQVSGKITKRERCSMHVEKVFGSGGKSVMKLKKEEEDEDSGRWESEMTQERVLTDWDDNEEADRVFLSSNTSTTGGEETGNNNKGDGNMLDKTNELVYERSGCERGGSTFMEVDLIPIPGPPGSFLQCPWDMETEHHGNYAVITSHVKSSQDQPDLTDRNSSESVISNHAALETQTYRLHNIITTVPAAPSNSNSVLRLMGKDLVVINQLREETSHGDYSSLKPTSQPQNLSKKQHVSPPVHRPYGGNSLYLNTSTSFYNNSDQEIPLDF